MQHSGYVASVILSPSSLIYSFYVACIMSRLLSNQFNLIFPYLRMLY